MLSKTDLWIVPPSQHSAWFAHLDWYLNWQMCKGLVHRTATPDAQVFMLAKEYEIPVSSSTVSEKSPLLISCGTLVPAKSCLVLPFKGDLKEWLIEAKTIAFKLMCANVHIFLPAGSETDKAEKAWSKLSGECTVTFFEDTEAQQ